MDFDEIKQFKTQLADSLNVYNKPFSLFVDIRDFVPAEIDVIRQIQEIQKMCRHKSIKRAAVIISSPVVKRQLMQSSYISETSDIDRIIDATKADNWEEQALEWIEHAVEPLSAITA